METSKLDGILAAHRAWLDSDPSGVRADLTGADLTDADLRGADLRGANLTDADLMRADLMRADLTGADLTGADLTRAILRSAYLMDAILRSANLTRAILRSANLTDADLRGADLTDAGLTDAGLTRADLRGADLTRADLTDADLRGADLTRADLTDADLRDAILGDETVLETGEAWKDYLAETLPQLLHAAAHGIEAIAAWDRHDWDSCPMHVAFDASSEAGCPALLRPRVHQFVRLFDARLLPRPTVDPAGRIVVTPPSFATDSIGIKETDNG